MPEKRNFSPINSASSSNVRFSVQLPEFVNPDDIGINVQQIRRLCHLGGIRHLQVVGVSNGERTQYSPTIVGANEQGSAYAAQTGVRSEVSTFKTRSDLRRGGHYFMGSSATWTDATIEINMDEVKQRIQQDTSLPQGVRTSSAWVEQINTALKKGISQIGVNHLLLGMTKGQAIYAAVNTVDAILIAGNAEPLINPLMHDWHPHVPSIEESLFGIGIRWAILNIFERIYLKNQVDGPFRMSLFYGPQLDRAAILWTMAKSRRLAKVLS